MRPPGTDEGSEDNQDVVVLPDHLFTWNINTSDLKQRIQKVQASGEKVMLQWEEPHSLTREQGVWVMRGCVVVPEDTDLRHEILKLTHDHPTAGHPGAKKMLLLTARDYWWPRMANFISQYVKGCRICQATKPALVQPKPPLYPITTESSALPFSTIALDLIVDLPPSQGYVLRYCAWTAAMSFFFYSCFAISSPRHLPSPRMTPEDDM